MASQCFFLLNADGNTQEHENKRVLHGCNLRQSAQPNKVNLLFFAHKHHAHSSSKRIVENILY